MSRAFIKKLYERASKEGYAIGAFNFSTMEILHGIMDAAINLRSPVIVSMSEGEEEFFGAKEAAELVDMLRHRLHDRMILHADHHKTFESCKRSILAGFPSIHIDGSKLDYKENLAVTRKVVKFAHKNNVWVEGELGHVGGSSTLHKEDISKVALPEYMTNPDQAKEFVEKTGVDSLAVNVGNAHGIWKGAPKLDFKRLEEIKKKTKKHLVLHGGSGIDTASFRKAIKIGIDKININSEMRIAYADALTKAMKTKKDFTPYNYMQNPTRAVTKVVEEKIKIFGSAGKL